MNTRSSFPGGKAAGAGESILPRAAIDNEWRYSSAHIDLYGASDIVRTV